MKKVIDSFQPQGGAHCITTSLRQIFSYYGHPLPEAMLFGLGEGLDFTYINLAASPMISGRSKVMEFEAAPANRLGIRIQVKQGKDSDRAHALAKQCIDQDNPVVAYVDMPMLSYLGMDPASHFGGHSVVLFGYDDQREVYYVSDRDSPTHPIRTPAGPMSEAYHLVPYAEMRAARSSSHRPFPANNKSLAFDFSGYCGIHPESLTAAIRAVCEKMLYPPARLKGVRGIEKFAGEVRRWKAYDPERLRCAGATNYFQISADGGTGGGIFRRMYGTFLQEAAAILESASIRLTGAAFAALSEHWDGIADQLWQLHERGDPGLLAKVSESALELCHTETQLLTQLAAQVG